MKTKKLTRKEKALLRAPVAAVAAQEKDAAAKRNRLTVWLALIVAVTGFLLYANTLDHSYVLDDYSVIKENRLTRQGWNAFPEILVKSYRFGYYFINDELYRPLPKAMFAAEWALFPDKPAPAHWINVLLYAFTGWMLFRVLYKYSGNNHLLAFVVSMLFIAHPIHTEVVANIKSRDEILSFLFFILSLDWIKRYIGDGRTTALGVAILCYLLSLLSKESGITLVAVFPLWLYFFSAGNVKQRVRVSLSMAAVAVLFLSIRNQVLASNLKENFALADNVLMGIPDAAGRFATAVHILGIYLGKLVFPDKLVFDMSFNQIVPVSVGDWGFIVPFAVLTGLFAWSLIAFRKREFSAFGILFFLVTVSVFSNIFVIIGTSYGERLMYIPSLGFALLAGYLISLPGKKEPGVTTTTPGAFFRGHAVALLICLTVVAAYAYKTVSRNAVWKNNFTLFSNDVNLSPNSTRTHYYLGNYMTRPENIGVDPSDTLRMMRVLDSAIVELKKAAAIHTGFCDVYKQLGVAYGKKHDLRTSFDYYLKAIECNPTDAPAHSNIGTIYFEQGNYTEALNAFKKAVALDPNYTESLMNLGSTYGMLKDYPNALKYLHQCVKTDPGNASAHRFLSITYGLMGDQRNAALYEQKFKQLSGKP